LPGGPGGRLVFLLPHAAPGFHHHPMPAAIQFSSSTRRFILVLTDGLGFFYIDSLHKLSLKLMSRIFLTSHVFFGRVDVIFIVFEKKHEGSKEKKVC
jgi:hypothetical protein